ncbi:hypothetical protein [Altericista sp. CCNU0014]|uniref:hypothetical protein n=1 Tax=Altericista sp. CCNU0014 TaxID=3082949 RepID=UPI00384C995C
MYLPTFTRRWRSPAPDVQQAKIAPKDRASFAQQHFYHRCDRSLQNLLSRCDWRIVWRSEVPVLTISCPNTFLYGQILHEMVDISRALQSLGCNACNATIRIYRPLGGIFPLKLRAKDLLPHAVVKQCATVKDISCQLLTR